MWAVAWQMALIHAFRQRYSRPCRLYPRPGQAWRPLGEAPKNRHMRPIGKLPPCSRTNRHLTWASPGRCPPFFRCPAFGARAPANDAGNAVQRLPVLVCPCRERPTRHQKSSLGLDRQGPAYDRKAVAAGMMRQCQIAKAEEKFKAGTDSEHYGPVSSSLLEQEFRADAPGVGLRHFLLYFVVKRMTNSNPVTPKGI